MLPVNPLRDKVVQPPEQTEVGDATAVPPTGAITVMLITAGGLVHPSVEPITVYVVLTVGDTEIGLPIIVPGIQV
jgi:hypothetical protein